MKIHACSDAPNARLIGIEYIISPRLFEKLPDDEKRYWHSHKHEIESGSLVVSAAQTVVLKCLDFRGSVLVQPPAPGKEQPCSFLPPEKVCMLCPGSAHFVFNRLSGLASCLLSAKWQAWKATRPHSAWQHPGTGMRGGAH